MVNSDLKIRTKEYALSVIRLFAALPKRTETQILGRQLLRAGTSVEDSRDGRVRVTCSALRFSARSFDIHPCFNAPESLGYVGLRSATGRG